MKVSVKIVAISGDVAIEKEASVEWDYDSSALLSVPSPSDTVESRIAEIIRGLNLKDLQWPVKN